MRMAMKRPGHTRLTLQLPDSVHARVKSWAATHRRDMQEMVVMLLEETLSLPSAFDPPTVSPLMGSTEKVVVQPRTFEEPAPLTPAQALLEMDGHYRNLVDAENYALSEAETATRAEYKYVPGSEAWVRPMLAENALEKES